MKIFVTGVCGQLGFDVVHEAKKRGYEVIGSDILKESPVEEISYKALDITDEDAVHRMIMDIRPDVIVHCAAWTAVDAAEAPENREKVRKINVDGTRYLAEAAKAVDAKMVYISTDYVFDGSGTRPWEPEDREFAPLNYYGESKLGGELAVSGLLKKYFIVRIAWVFGKNGKNFVRTMLRVGKNRDFVTVVDDQIGTPTYTYDLARLLVDMIETEKYGVYHATNSEADGRYISWAEYTEWIYQTAGYKTEVRHVSTEEYGLSVAKRPYNSRLGKKKLVEMGFEPLPDWKDAVSRYISELDMEEL